MLAAAVILGLAVTVALSMAAGLPAGPLPGMALGSVAVLMAERAIVLFAVWMVLLVVVVRAFRGELPIEISGRGVRYAAAEEVNAKTTSVDDSLRTVEHELAWLRKTVEDLALAEAKRRRKEEDDW